ncbi:tRNA pseudouridine(38-40) synthase TruA [Nocardioides bizhenqiangii]|uniref:tRNA pseudouridine synthase A n=1 Tax=Nocardioides bizhenqiangii TaxID=3095076 RepID=A0ABZ0ZN82_9ACTN|nr:MULTISPECIES: tRNA pseudouridine(38-40) synthase TruA [unclassified Nocardioides]MDZ5621380.1 tRNA pseudouridine(38-40) synthase TruA [Nocardioides sp. HM23]WQQ25780.1 tRNA pseudouridine(38-40) synthase TruA [Nocardioides sp. HM61]
MRLRIDLAYDGTDFHGWAAQPALRTVQDELTTALATVLRTPADQLQVVCAGRTDAGVHARGQVAHVDVADDLDDGDLQPLARRVNGVLPPDVRVHRIGVAPDGFDARFAALWRRYAYRIADSAEAVDPLHRQHVLAWPRPLDLGAMNAAAAPLVGLHDFASFCKQRPGATTIRTLLELSWSRDEAGVAVGRVRADAFCHSMVRALVGCLVAVGEGRRPPEWAHGILTAEQRDPAVAVLHAHGLTLEEVAYPPDHELAARVERTAARRGTP